MRHSRHSLGVFGLVAAAAISGCGVTGTPPPLIAAFHQGPRGNCTSVGFIKAAMSAYGHIDGAFARLAATPDGGLEATLKYGDARGASTIRVSAQELAIAAAASGLVVGVDSPEDHARVDEANRMFAILGQACATDCRGAHTYCSSTAARSCDTFAGALDYLNSGLDWKTPPGLLGLRQGTDWRTVKGWTPLRWWRTTRFVRGGVACVAATGKHTFLVSNGYADLWGKAREFSRFGNWFAFTARNAYCLDPVEASVAFSDGSDQPPDDVAHDPDFAKMTE